MKGIPPYDVNVPAVSATAVNLVAVIPHAMVAAPVLAPGFLTVFLAPAPLVFALAFALAAPILAGPIRFATDKSRKPWSLNDDLGMRHRDGDEQRKRRDYCFQ